MKVILTLKKKPWSEVPTRPETKNDCSGEGQQQFNRPTDSPSLSLEDDVRQATLAEACEAEESPLLEAVA
jgi:hypothetical protein